MQGSLLRFYLHEDQRHHGRLLWEWLLEEACAMGVPGGSAFRAVGGFGRDRHVREDRFVELGGSLAIEVEFVVSDEQAWQLLELVRLTGLRVVHASMPVRFGVLNDN
jgi:uncharacterized protein